MSQSGKRNMATRALRKQLSKLPEELGNHPGCSAIPFENDIFRLKATIPGPDDSPYQGGTFELEIQYSIYYPFKPPKVHFKTSLCHPNVAENGMVCIDFLKKEWKPCFSVSYVLLAICSLMMHPNADNPIRPQIADLYVNDRDKFNEKARQMTQQFAIPVPKSQNMKNTKSESPESSENVKPLSSEVTVCATSEPSEVSAQAKPGSSESSEKVKPKSPEVTEYTKPELIEMAEYTKSGSSEVSDQAKTESIKMAEYTKTESSEVTEFTKHGSSEVSDQAKTESTEVIIIILIIIISLFYEGITHYVM